MKQLDSEMHMMGTKEASEQWGVPQHTVAKWCCEGKIIGKVEHDAPGSPWRISRDAQPPYNRK